MSAAATSPPTSVRQPRTPRSSSNLVVDHQLLRRFTTYSPGQRLTSDDLRALRKVHAAYALIGKENVLPSPHHLGSPRLDYVARRMVVGARRAANTPSFRRASRRPVKAKVPTRRKRSHSNAFRLANVTPQSSFLQGVEQRTPEDEQLDAGVTKRGSERDLHNSPGGKRRPSTWYVVRRCIVALCWFARACSC